MESIMGLVGGRRRRQDQTSKIPDEIIFNILSKLPIRSVVQCRCVCKSWLAIIADPQFAKAHLAHSTVSIILWSYIPEINIMYSVELDTFQVSNSITWACQSNNGKAIRVAGSCNGLICFSNYNASDPVYVCNPFTRQSMALPKSDHHSPSLAALGFGFTLNTGEYKVVRARHIYPKNGKHCPIGSYVEVYTLGTGCWIPYVLDLENYFNTLLNGAFHWISINISPHKFKRKIVIVSLDIGDEEFCEIQLPDFGPAIGSRVGVIEGCLSIHNYSDRGCIDIWIMKVYGVKESWSKYLVFSELRPAYHLLDIPKKEKPILGHCKISNSWSEKLVTYDTRSRRFKDLRLHKVLDFNLAFRNVASLITLESALHIVAF